jgi:hypothetical protein
MEMGIKAGIKTGIKTEQGSGCNARRNQVLCQMWGSNQRPLSQQLPQSYCYEVLSSVPGGATETTGTGGKETVSEKEPCTAGNKAVGGRQRD